MRGTASGRDKSACCLFASLGCRESTPELTQRNEADQAERVEMENADVKEDTKGEEAVEGSEAGSEKLL